MKSEFDVEYRSTAHNDSLMFTSIGRTPTHREFQGLVAKHESVLANRLPDDVEIIELDRLPPTNEPTLLATIVAGPSRHE
jgi:hypothetical protein